MTLKSGIFSLLANCVLLGISGGHVQVHHICLKKYFSSSRQFLDKNFVKNNHPLDLMQAPQPRSDANFCFTRGDFSRLSEWLYSLFSKIYRWSSFRKCIYRLLHFILWNLFLLIMLYLSYKNKADPIFIKSLIFNYKHDYISKNIMNSNNISGLKILCGKKIR